jgi:hypothetical protein
MLLNALNFYIWASVVDSHLTGPQMTMDHISGIQYADFLERTLPLLLGGVSLSIQRGMCFHHDSAISTFHIECTIG